MNKINTKLVGRVGAAAAISLGLAASAISVASASTDGSRLSGHDSTGGRANCAHGLGGIASLVSSTSVTVTGHDGTSKTYAISPTATYTEGSTSVPSTDLVNGVYVEIQVSSSDPATATSIDIKVAHTHTVRLGGDVTAASATSVTVSGWNGTSNIYAITPTTAFFEGSTAVLASALEVGDRISIQVSASDVTTATTITIAPARFSGQVTGATLTTITITDHKGVSDTIDVGLATTYTKDGATSLLSAVTSGLYISAQGFIGATPTTLDASSVSIGNPCGNSGHVADGHEHSDTHGFGGNQGSGNQGSRNRGFGGHGSSHHGNFRR
jgi:hypothetical protein